MERLNLHFELPASFHAEKHRKVMVRLFATPVLLTGITSCTSGSVVRLINVIMIISLSIEVIIIGIIIIS